MTSYPKIQILNTPFKAVPRLVVIMALAHTESQCDSYSSLLRNSLMCLSWNTCGISDMFLLSRNMCSDGKHPWYGSSNWSPGQRRTEQALGNLLRDGSPSLFQPIDGIGLQCRNDGPQGGKVLQDSTFLYREWQRHKRHLDISITVGCWLPVLAVLQLLWILTTK